jgi:hypothetical protein
MACTAKPSMRASGRAAAARSAMSRAAWLAASGVSRLSSHAAHVGLVGDVAGNDLDRQRVVPGQQVGGDRVHRLDAVGDDRLGHGHAEGGEHRLGLGLAEQLAPFGCGLRHGGARRRRVGGEAVGQFGGVRDRASCALL